MPTLNFKGKTFIANHHLAVPHHQLVPKPELSLLKGALCSLHDNLVVQGDNLLALKALLPTYGNKIKCIYIDPPYNTGNEGWAYNDNMNNPMMMDWLGKVVDKEDLTRHDKWLCMMMPRLKLLRELLTEDGAIFISCDDNEQHRLRMLCDEVFGEGNFIAVIAWQKKYGPANDAKYISDTHEYVLIYSKNIENFKTVLIPRSEDQLSDYKNPDNDPRGVWRASDLSVKTPSPSCIYEIIGPNGDTYQPPDSRSWNVTKQKFDELLADNRITFGTKGTGRPMTKRFLSEVKEGITQQTWWDRNFAGDNKVARYEIKELFQENEFATPKSLQLLRRLFQVFDTKNAIILDSFAGSGTTAHAVMQLNKEDGGNRKFILIEMEDYANSLTAERVRRVMQGVPESKNFKEGLGGSFSYWQLDKPIELETLLDGSNLPDWNEMARYLFYTSTGEQANQKKFDNKTGFIGESTRYNVYMCYEPNIEWLKQNALTLKYVQNLPTNHAKNKKMNLVFAPAKYVDDDNLQTYSTMFCQLPFEIYRLAK